MSVFVYNSEERNLILQIFAHLSPRCPSKYICEHFSLLDWEKWVIKHPPHLNAWRYLHFKDNHSRRCQILLGLALTLPVDVAQIICTIVMYSEYFEVYIATQCQWYSDFTFNPHKCFNITLCPKNGDCIQNGSCFKDEATVPVKQAI